MNYLFVMIEMTVFVVATSPMFSEHTSFNNVTTDVNAAAIPSH